MGTSTSPAPAPPDADAMRPARARTLAEWLAARSDDALADLLIRRPELARPAPHDITTLAARATASSSVARAINLLDRFRMEILEALTVLPDPIRVDDLAAALDQPPGLVTDRLALLHDLALVWGDDDLRAVRAVHELLGPNPAGLGPATTHHYGNLDALVAECGDDARALLDTLVWGPPTTAAPHADRPVTKRTARTPVEQLLARGLLVARDATTAALPRQVGLHLRAGRVHRRTHPEPPPAPEAAPVSPKRAAHAAAGAALDVVSDIERVVDRIALLSPPALRTGGLGVREVRALATAEGLPAERTRAALEFAWTAGLIALVEAGAGSRELYVPAPAYAEWLGAEIADRWGQVTFAWLHSPRTSGLVGSADERGRTHAVLAPHLDRTIAPEVRALTLDALAAADGQAPPTDWLHAHVAWHRPRRGGTLRDDIVGWTVEEAAALGVTGLGALSAAGRELRDAESPEQAAAAVAGEVPPPVDRLIVQADLTATAPGPLPRDIAEEVRLLADAESHGGARVFRFTPESVRRALDHGRTADDLHAWLAAHSLTGVPQALTYLIDDVARRHGVLRLGAAGAYLVCDDTDLIDRLSVAGALPGVTVRKLADTVAVTATDPATLLSRLQAAGLHPVADSADCGTVGGGALPGLRLPRITDSAAEVHHHEPRPALTRSQAERVVTVVRGTPTPRRKDRS